MSGVEMVSNNQLCHSLSDSNSHSVTLVDDSFIHSSKQQVAFLYHNLLLDFRLLAR